MSTYSCVHRTTEKPGNYSYSPNYNTSAAHGNRGFYTQLDKQSPRGRATDKNPKWHLYVIAALVRLVPSERTIEYIHLPIDAPHKGGLLSTRTAAHCICLTSYDVSLNCGSENCVHRQIDAQSHSGEHRWTRLARLSVHINKGLSRVCPSSSVTRFLSFCFFSTATYFRLPQCLVTTKSPHIFLISGAQQFLVFTHSFHFFCFFSPTRTKCSGNFPFIRQECESQSYP